MREVVRTCETVEIMLKRIIDEGTPPAVIADLVADASVNARLETVLQWLREAQPDVVGLQEIKCVDEKFPREEIEALNERIYANLNDGVYQAGFASSQEAYEDAFDRVFATLDWLDERLAHQRYLTGDRVTEADWRLFSTLVRFDPVYVGHFKCNLRRIADYPQISGYLRDLYQRPGIAETVNMDHIKRHYYGTHPQLNPSGIVPKGPELDYDAPHDRDRLGLAAA